MMNKKEKKNALKKMLNEKTLLEMSGGGDLDPSITNIPGAVTLGADGTTPGMEVNGLLNNINGLKKDLENVENILGGDKFCSKLNDNVTSKIELEENLYKNIGGVKPTPYSVEDLVDNKVYGLPLYLADQIAKSTGNNNPTLPTGLDVDELSKMTYSLEFIKNDITEFNNLTTKKPVNRYLTLFDLITDDNGEFLSKDLNFILNRFSSLAQFKHLPRMEYLLQDGGNRKRNKSRKLRK